jgi:hypothetical protein
MVGIQILATDYWLWATAPTHAYGLIAFVALDLALILGVLRTTPLVIFGALLTATFQFVAMLGDIVAGEPVGLSAAVFRNYLLADAAYIGLLVTQGLIMAIAIGSWALPHLHDHWPEALRIVRN